MATRKTKPPARSARKLGRPPRVAGAMRPFWVKFTPREYALLVLACPPERTVSDWARDVVLELISKG